MIWNQKIKELREQSHLTLLEVSKKLGVSEATAQRYESDTGIKNIPYEQIIKYAELFNVTPAYIMGWEENPKFRFEARSVPHHAQRIKVLGKVAAGTPIEMIQDVEYYEEMPLEADGDYFGLIIKGDSMEPRIMNGDVVIVKQQPLVENGEIGIVTVNGEDATCKRIYKYAESLVLMSNNPKYPPREFTKEQVEALPVRILGRVVELRAKF
jgi:repressor LexA